MDWEKPCYNSSCEPAATERRSKKRSRIAQMHTESLTTDFFDLCFFRCIGILNGFASVTACGCRGWTYFFCPFGQLYLSIISIGDS